MNENQWIARLLAENKATTDASLNMYRLRNIGGFEFSYMLGVVAFCLTWTALNSKSMFIKMFSILTVILSFYYIIQSMYTTLLILTSLGVTSLLLLQLKNAYLKIIIILVALFLLSFLPSIINFVMNLFPTDNLLYQKFENIYVALINDDVDRMSSRPELLRNALHLWLQSPFIGITVEDRSHSTIISSLVCGGIVGFSIWLALIVFTWKFLYRKLKHNKINLNLFCVSFAYLVLLLIFNPIGYVFELPIATFFIVPIYSLLFCKISSHDDEKDIN